MRSQLNITHETVYKYREPVEFGQHRLVLRPREGHDLQVVSMALDIKPAHTIRWSRDVFGNSVATVDFHEPSDELSIVSRVTVNLHALPGLSEAHQTVVAYPVVYDDEETLVADAYKAAIYPADVQRLQTWLATAIAAADQTNAFAIVSTLNQAITNDIRYMRREEKGVQTPAETLEKRSGSCRDMATLLMEACRALGVAARFCSGYLDCAASVAGRASTHAWMEAYLPGRGWSGFDPTLGNEVSDRHVSIGLSNHPRAVMPVSGRFFGVRSDFIAMTVAVKFDKIA